MINTDKPDAVLHEFRPTLHMI